MPNRAESLVIISTCLLLFCAFCLFQRHVYTTEKILTGCEKVPVVIYFETDDVEAPAAAGYLACSLEHTLGTEPESVTAPPNL